MTTHQARDGARGGAPVGRLADLPAIEAAAVTYLRLWCSGAEAQAAVWSDYAAVFGPREGARQLKGFERMLGLVAEHALRPVVHHQPQCGCLGAQEGIFAAMIGAAAEGEREEAALFAALLVRPGVATHLAMAAEEVAMGLRRALVRAARTDPAAAPAAAPGGTRATHRASPARH